jgi:hypothetical protein
MKRILLGIIIPAVLMAQDAQIIEPLDLIDTPTAGTLMRGSFRGQLRAYENGGLLTALEVGLTDRFMFGISYGGTNLIGRGGVDWNPQVGATVRYRLLEEDLNLPALTLGYSSQGYGVYIDSTERYLNKSLGVFAALSKNYEFLGNFGIHGGLNYSFENRDGDKDLNFFVGIDKSLNPELSVMAEYDFAINDNSGKAIGNGNGYLNTALRWVFAGRLQIDFILKNILNNSEKISAISREIKITYVEIF